MTGDVTEEEIEGVNYLWFRTPSYKRNGLKRAVNMFAFVRQLRRYRTMLSSHCRDGAVIASSTYPLDVLPAKRIAREGSAKLVFEVHDLWPLSPIELGGMPRWHPFIAVLQWAEDFAYQNADTIISMLPKAEPYMLSHGLAKGKFVHIPNGIDATEWVDDAALPPQYQAVFAAARDRGHATILYAGAHGVANALDSLIKAAHLLRDRPVTTILVGQGPEKARLERITAELGLKNVVFLPPVKKSLMPALLRLSDLLIISLQRCPLFRFGVSPNKLIDYMMAGRPIIHAIAAGNDMVRDAGCGLSVPPEDPQAIADAALRIIALSPRQREEMGARAKAYVLKSHEYRILGAKFLHVLET
jgi:glycosyltransferase involved in cell wall biosynthesis